MAITWKIKGIYQADPQKVYEEINTLGEQVTPADIVEKAALEPESELHKCFEWRDSVAAAKYRVIQAQQIIRFLVVDSTDINPEAAPNKIRMLVKAEAPNAYQPMTVTFTNVDEYSRMLDQAKREMKAFVQKYSTLKELEPVFETIGAVM